MHDTKRSPLIAVAIGTVALLAACTTDEPAGVPNPARLTDDASLEAKSVKPAKIVFASGDEGSRSIYTMNPDGSGRTLVTGDWNGAAPTWSPDRRKLAFVHLNGPTIYVMNRTGAHVTLFNSGENPSWSSDGTQIAYDYQLGGNRDVMRGSADGPGVLQLTNDPADDEDPTWSPDGTEIAFVSNRTGAREIFVTDANGLVETQVTSCGAQGLSCSSPAWSPVSGDGRILFAAAGATNGIFTIRSDGTGLTPVRLFVGSLATEPVWSPDGTQIAFTRYMPATAADIYRMNADGTGLVQLTTDPRDDVSPAWSR